MGKYPGRVKDFGVAEDGTAALTITDRHGRQTSVHSQENLPSLQPPPLALYQPAPPFLPFFLCLALSQQEESLSGKTLLVVQALWDTVATTSVTPDRQWGSRQKEHNHYTTTSQCRHQVIIS